MIDQVKVRLRCFWIECPSLRREEVNGYVGGQLLDIFYNYASVRKLKLTTWPKQMNAAGGRFSFSEGGCAAPQAAAPPTYVCGFLDRQTSALFSFILICVILYWLILSDADFSRQTSAFFYIIFLCIDWYCLTLTDVAWTKHILVIVLSVLYMT